MAMTVEAIQERMLRAMHPAHGSQPPEKWQQRKSAQTRERLVESGIDCLVEGGYSGLTTAAVAERCGVSRGAMHHHFQTRMDLVIAVSEHVLYRRMRAFLDDYFATMRDSSEERMMHVATETHWRSVHTREYSAFLQLAVAARCDEELDAHLRPALVRYDEVWTSEMIEAFPQWSEHWEEMKLASDLVTATHIGMLVNEPVLGSGERMAALRELLAATVKTMHARTKTGSSA